MINKITPESVGEELFESITEDSCDTSYQDHRRASNFYTRWVFDINEEYFPDHPELWGFLESNTFVYDTEYGRDNGDIYELYRVEKKTKTIIKEYWDKVEGGEK
jgi:hypothetical protein